MSKYTILRVDASMNRHNSTSRMLAQKLSERLARQYDAQVIVRDLADGIPFIDTDWIDANFTDPQERSPRQQQALAVSDTLVHELRQADQLIIGVPIYNFGAPAAFKAWIDQIARARETFRYSERGPEGLLSMDKAWLIVSSGGTRIGSSMDHVTAYTKMLFGFLGITDMEVIPCEGLMTEGEEVLDQALKAVIREPGSRE